MKIDWALIFSLCSILAPLCCVGTALIVGGILLMRRRTKREDAAWGTLAQRTGLTFSPNPNPILPQTQPFIHGTYRGRAVEMIYTGELSDEFNYLMFQVSVNNPQEYYLELRRRGAGTAIKQALGAEETPIGYAAFDQVYIVASRPPEFAAQKLARQTILLQTLPTLQGFNATLSKNVLRCTLRQIEYNAAKAHSIIDALVMLAEAVER